MRTFLLTLCLSLAATATLADTRRVESRGDFLALVEGRALTRLGITLIVSPDGRIAGRAFGTPVSGAWQWQNGYFCRTLFHGKRDLGQNCQTVEQRGGSLRFTADRGAGMHADLALK